MPHTTDNADGVYFVRHRNPDKEGPRAFDPLKPDHHLVGQVCQACGFTFEVGQRTALIPLGPGFDEEARMKAKDGRYYNAIALPVHAACAGVEP